MKVVYISNGAIGTPLDYRGFMPQHNGAMIQAGSLVAEISFETKEVFCYFKVNRGVIVASTNGTKFKLRAMTAEDSKNLLEAPIEGKEPKWNFSKTNVSVIKYGESFVTYQQCSGCHVRAMTAEDSKNLPEAISHVLAKKYVEELYSAVVDLDFFNKKNVEKFLHFTQAQGA